MRDQAIGFAFDTYNKNNRLQASPFEWGYVLYSANGVLRTGTLVESPDPNSVVLYTPEDFERITGEDEAFDGEYVGDYHAHPFGVLWTSQFPSPQDVGHISPSAIFGRQRTEH